MMSEAGFLKKICTAYLSVSMPVTLPNQQNWSKEVYPLMEVGKRVLLKNNLTTAFFYYHFPLIKSLLVTPFHLCQSTPYILQSDKFCLEYILPRWLHASPLHFFLMFIQMSICQQSFLWSPFLKSQTPSA